MHQVGRYQILEELGRGAHGVVYKALDPAIGRTIAIKAIALGNINVEDRARVGQGILREARLAGTLSHPNIVTVYDVFESDDFAYIFMEFVDGQSLEEAIAHIKAKQPDKLSRAAFFSIFRQVAEALDYAHRKGVIHRDVKPANIVLTTGGDPATLGGGQTLAKIADFGVAKFASPEVTQQLSGNPALIGTPSYMSPEQVQGTVVSGASDQFSLAVIAYEVLCLRKPFAADTVEALLYRIRHDREQSAHVANTMLSTTVTKVLHRALAKNPEDRFATCSEFAGALEFAVGDSPAWETGLTRTIAERSTRSLVVYEKEEPAEEQKNWGWNLALILGLCLAVGLAIILIVRMNSGPPLITQILDGRSGPVSPPPTVEELKYDRHGAIPPLNPVKTASKTNQPAADNSPTVVRVPVPTPAAPASRAPAQQAPAQQPAQSVSAPAVPKPEVAKKVMPVVERPVRQIATQGEVELQTDTPGVNVTVDGASSCLTPCTLTLRAGRHTLEASMPGFGVSRKIFYVPADRSITVPMVRSQGVLLVSSEPSGARVSVDGTTVGSTPLTLRLSPGVHRVSVWDGTRWRDESLQVAADEVHTRLFRF